MGGVSSRFSRRNPDNHSSSDSTREAPGYQSYSPAAPSSYISPPPPSYATLRSHSEPNQPQGGRRNNWILPRIGRSYSRIIEDYVTVDQFTDALSSSGLQSARLIVGIDFTKSNEWKGKVSFGGRSLHHIGDKPNPYEQAISIIGRMLSAFDKHNWIPCFGFGDTSTLDQDVFSFYHEGRPCNGFPDALQRYRELVPLVRLPDPTSFAPLIEMATTIVEQSGGQYHVLVIIADGQAARRADTQSGHLSPQEQKTVDAIVKASEFPLSIILVGVGDGPWDMMQEFDYNIPARAFDNFQFVNFTEIMSRDTPQHIKEAAFGHVALMEIPLQYMATLDLGILGRQSGKSPRRVPLAPPIGGFRMSAPLYPEYETTSSAPLAPPNSSLESQVCPICLTNPRDMAFGCGHLTCSECAPSLQTCPICRREISTRIKLY